MSEGTICKLQVNTALINTIYNIAKQRCLAIEGVEKFEAQVVPVYDIGMDELSTTTLVFNVFGTNLDIEAIVDVKWDIINSTPDCPVIALNIHDRFGR